MKKSSKNRLGTLGEPEAKRMVKAFYEDCRLRRRVAILCGAMLGLVMILSQAMILTALVP